MHASRRSFMFDEAGEGVVERAIENSTDGNLNSTEERVRKLSHGVPHL
jgi:hypothetical protein